MAFECITYFTDACLQRAIKFTITSQDVSLDEHLKGCRKSRIIWDSLYDYYQTVLSHPKFKAQKHYCKMVLFRLDYYESKLQLRNTKNIPSKSQVATYFKIPEDQIL